MRLDVKDAARLWDMLDAVRASDGKFPSCLMNTFNCSFPN